MAKKKQNNLYLCFIAFIGKENSDKSIYDFYFSNTTEEFWGDDFEQKPAGICRLIEPYNDTYTVKKRCVINFKLDLAQEQTCFSMQDVIDGCCALGWENIDNIEYPEDGRIVFHFGEPIKDVTEKLMERDLFFIEESN